MAHSPIVKLRQLILQRDQLRRDIVDINGRAMRCTTFGTRCIVEGDLHDYQQQLDRVLRDINSLCKANNMLSDC